MRTPKNLIQHELIGLEAEVASATSPSFVGLRGTVTDETRQLLVLSTPAGLKRVPKDVCTFRFRLPGAPAGREWVRVRGSLLVGRPEDRVKKRLARW